MGIACPPVSPSRRVLFAIIEKGNAEIDDGGRIGGLSRIAEGGGAQLAAACGRCSAVATANPVLCETVAVEFTGFE